jgi:predicted transcriptional regulator
MSDKRTGSISARVAPALKSRLEKISDYFGVPPTRMIEDALEALADYVEREGRYRRPMRMEPAEIVAGVEEATTASSPAVSLLEETLKRLRAIEAQRPALPASPLREMIREAAAQPPLPPPITGPQSGPPSPKRGKV